ncbi:MAG: hypothetical protein E7053_01425 [Lentisphaerae bacterium]|nr:hypothetical protein [Lentisphaerota bacterium]
MLSDIFFLTGCIIFLFAPVCFCSIFFNERPERIFYITLLINSMIFYFMAIFHVAQSGFAILYTANLLLYIPVFYKIRKENRQKIIVQLITPGSVILLTAIIVSFFISRYMIIASWDAISHWGKTVKLFIEEGKLGCEYPANILNHASYPPGSGMTSALIHNCFFSDVFRDGIFIFAHCVSSFATLAWLFSFFTWGKQRKVTVILLLSSIILPLLTLLDCFTYGLTDSILTITMAIAFYQLISMKNFHCWEIFSFAVLTSWLFMIRDAGWGYAVALLLLWTIIIITNRKNVFFSPDNHTISKSKCVLVALTYILPLAMKSSWSILLSYYHTPIRFDNHARIDVLSLFATPESRGWELLKRFLIQFSCGYLEFFLLLVAIGIYLIYRTSDKSIIRQVKITLIFFSVALLFFISGIFLFYCREFTSLDRFPSFFRYVNGFLLIPAFVLLLIYSDIYSRSPSNGNHNSTSCETKDIIKIIALTILLGLLQLIPIKETGTYTRWRTECDNINRYASVIQQPESSFIIICTNGNGFKSLYMSYLYPYNFRDSAYWDPVLPGSPESRERAYSQEITPENLKEEFSQVKYVFFDNPQEDFLRNFQALFAPGIQIDQAAISGKLFQVTSIGLVPVQQ